MKIKELHEQRGKLLRESQNLVERAQREGRALNDAEGGKLSQNRTEIFGLDTKIANHQSEMRGMTPVSYSDPGGLPDLSGYSLTRAIARAGQGGLDGLELEVSQEIARRSNRSASGFFVPHAALVESRDLTVGSATNGAEMVGTRKDRANFIDALRPLLAVAKAGATVMDNLSSNVSIPRQTAASTASWKSETGELDKETPEISQLELSPKRVGAYSVMSKQLLIQTSPDVEKIVRRDLMSAAAVALDAAAIAGTGSGGQPTGILNTTGIGSVEGGTDGAAPTWQDIVDLVGEIENANALDGRLAFVTNPKVAAKLRATPKIASTDSRMILEGSELVGNPFWVSNNVPSNLTKGSGTDLSAIIFGDFSGVILASFGDGIDMIVDPFSEATAGKTRIVANFYADVGIRRAEQFAAMSDAITS